jgi:hypothetical protein
MSASDIQNLAPTDPDLTCPICSKLLRDAVDVLLGPLAPVLVDLELLEALNARLALGAEHVVVENMSASDIQNLAPTDPDLTCPICSKLLRDAVLTPSQDALRRDQK